MNIPLVSGGLFLFTVYFRQNTPPNAFAQRFINNFLFFGVFAVLLLDPTISELLYPTRQIHIGQTYFTLFQTFPILLFLIEQILVYFPIIALLTIFLLVTVENKQPIYITIIVFALLVLVYYAQFEDSIELTENVDELNNQFTQQQNEQQYIPKQQYENQEPPKGQQEDQKNVKNQEKKSDDKNQFLELLVDFFFELLTDIISNL